MDRLQHPDEYRYSPIVYRYNLRMPQIGKRADEEQQQEELFLEQRPSRSATELFPRASRNAWFRIATYQNYKPVNSEEALVTESPMRWGR